MEYAREHYDFDDARIRAQEHIKKVMENYPAISAEEAEQYIVFEALMRTGKLTICPAKLDGERAVAIVQVTWTPTESRITPLAILMVDEIADLLEVPYDEGLGG